jgi:hypothetical protein
MALYVELVTPAGGAQEAGANVNHQRLDSPTALASRAMGCLPTQIDSGSIDSTTSDNYGNKLSVLGHNLQIRLEFGGG